MGITAEERTTRRLLACGAVGAPLFVASILILGATREGYDPASNYVSSLSSGPGGWVQIATFVVCGLLLLGFAAGVGRRLDSGRGSKWAPRLLAAYALGLVASGAFVADRGWGYPPGAPSGTPETASLHGGLHVLASLVVFLSLAAACVLLARRFATRRELRAWAIYSALSAVAILVFNPTFAAEETRGLVQRAGIIAGWTWVTALAIRLIDPGAAISRPVDAPSSASSAASSTS